MKKGFGAVLVLGLLMSPHSLGAQETFKSGEIYYGAIQEITGDEFLAKYSSPGGDVFMKCSADTLECGVTSSVRLLGSSAYKFSTIRNQQGTSALETFRFPGMSQPFYYLYSIEGGELTNKKLLTYFSSSDATHFSRDGKYFVFQNANGSLARGSVETRRVGSTYTLPISPYRLLSISPNGKFAAGYSDSLKQYGFVDLSNGQTAVLSSEYGSLVEFSDDGKFAAVLTQDASGNHELSLLNLSSFPTITTVSQKVNKGKVVTDYLFSGNQLFYMSNDDSALMWKLVALDPTTQNKTTVDSNASYGDYIKSIDGNLFYLKQNGKVRDIYRYSTEEKETQKISGGPTSPAATNLSRKEIDVAGVHGALIEPTSASGKTLPLIIWMHGGPQRQTSVGYHPYLSYGVYDELLEKMAQQSARVFKIDYTGSWGYGKTFIDALRDRVGVVEMTDIRNSISALKTQYPTSKVYLIGNSYGGYTALKGATDFPNLVSGTVAIAPVTDWFTLIYEIPGSPFTQQFGGQTTDPLTQEKYRAASIIKDLQKIDSDPVVLVYGENDTTVPPRQSRQFLTVASSIGKDNVEGVELEGEDHVIKYRESLTKLCIETVETFNFSKEICN